MSAENTDLRLIWNDAEIYPTNEGFKEKPLDEETSKYQGKIVVISNGKTTEIPMEELIKFIMNPKSSYESNFDLRGEKIHRMDNPVKFKKMQKLKNMD